MMQASFQPIPGHVYFHVVVRGVFFLFCSLLCFVFLFCLSSPFGILPMSWSDHRDIVRCAMPIRMPKCYRRAGYEGGRWTTGNRRVQITSGTAKREITCTLLSAYRALHRTRPSLRWPSLQRCTEATSVLKLMPTRVANYLC
ncbi:hypothetical protein GGS23DRAFT_200747 [Durotheca rogersii]|uniref:uncharacterized protein n=1 Tax=Durotheca rogersii TaxID=419775 RepID=UPI00221F13CA|nr:uncharacterized protein GGS23DRAFT_200747 [Durotheca rogersii]KAI5867849.1 hypothetical protein GGS23DRAFT_200747 [Durotheca rogersii]